MTEKKKSRSDPWRWLAIAVSILTLPGIVDGVVTWKEWFEFGWMEHWRSVKHWLHQNLFVYSPVPVPSWLPEYFLLGSTFVRSFLTGLPDAFEEFYKHPALLVFICIVWISIWPILFITFMISIATSSEIVIKNIGSLLKQLLISIFGAIIVVIIASDAIERLGGV